MVVEEGNKILVAHRRLFEKDELRFFLARVDAYEAGIARATGHSYVWDKLHGGIIEKADERTKIISFSSGTLIVYLLPDEVLLDTLKFVSAENRLSLTDGKGFTMNLGEHPYRGSV